MPDTDGALPMHALVFALHGGVLSVVCRTQLLTYQETFPVAWWDTNPEEKGCPY